jgi:hypothetical protein
MKDHILSVHKGALPHYVLLYIVHNKITIFLLYEKEMYECMKCMRV